jgi:hypothetical protein
MISPGAARGPGRVLATNTTPAFGILALAALLPPPVASGCVYCIQAQRRYGRAIPGSVRKASYAWRRVCLRAITLLWQSTQGPRARAQATALSR